MTGRTLASLVLLAITMSSCGDDDDDANGVHAADVLSAAIRDVVDGQPATDEEHTPVVFVVGVGEDGIDAEGHRAISSRPMGCFVHRGGG